MADAHVYTFTMSTHACIHTCNHTHTSIHTHNHAIAHPDSRLWKLWRILGDTYISTHQNEQRATFLLTADTIYDCHCRKIPLAQKITSPERTAFGVLSGSFPQQVLYKLLLALLCYPDSIIVIVSLLLHRSKVLWKPTFFSCHPSDLKYYPFVCWE